MASTVSSPSKSLQNLSLRPLKMHLACLRPQLSDVTQQSAQTDTNPPFSTSNRNTSSKLSHHHLMVQASENKSTAAEVRPKVVLKFHDGEKSEKFETSELKSTETEEGAKVVIKVGAKSNKTTDERDQTLVAAKRKTFLVTMTREDIEAQLLEVNGSKRIRRAKKRRPKSVQSILDNLFPGLRLNSIKAEDYKVPDSP